ncbi:TIGR01627 domain-containing protein [Lyngbya sp. CCY1209]|nr:TIGR01627 domain-containing protein [Lyngbya sp. CCY1209]
MLVILPDESFPNLIIGDKRYSRWRYSRKEVPHNRYVDRRYPGVGFLNRDEAHVLYNTALRFRGKKALEIGCWLGWSACHLALAGVELDVVDPLLAQPEFYESVSSCLRAAKVLDLVNLMAGYSPAKVEEFAGEIDYKWSLIFIDGNHEAPGPLDDAIACEKLADEDALILFHDLASPDVSQGLDYFKEKGWNTMIYQTAQIMGVAWRGNVEPVEHQPDPRVQWSLPEHLRGYVVSGSRTESPQTGQWKVAPYRSPLIPFELTEINLIYFPNWESEEEASVSLEKVIKAVLKSEDRDRITLLIESDRVSEEQANLLLSGAVMQILMEEEIEIEEEPNIHLLRNLNPRQWSALLPQIQYKIELEDEPKAGISRAKNLPVIQIADSEKSLQIELSPSLEKFRNQIVQLVENNPGQMSRAEYSYITERVGEKAPGNFLIFGVGKDSPFWIEVNENGKTVFLEDNQDWLNQVRASCSEIDAHSVRYNTTRRRWLDLLAQHAQGIDCLLMELPDRIWETRWDFIFVDAPAGYAEDVPGRMQSIYTASLLALNSGHTDVFVHDCDRLVETIYSGYFLHDENLVTQVGKLKHYQINDRNLIDYTINNRPQTRAYRNGEQLIAGRHFLKAIFAFDRAIADNPSDVDSLIQLGQLSVKLGDLKEAKQLFNKAVSLERRNPLTMKKLAEVLMALNEIQEATNILEHLVQIKPEDVSLWSLLETCYKNMSWDEKATAIDGHIRDIKASQNINLFPTHLSETNIAKTQPKRILVINNLYPPQELGGYGRRICDFANVLGKRGHTIHALASDAPYLGEIKSPEPDVTRELLLCGTYENLPPKQFEDESEVRRIVEHNDRVIRETIENYAPDVCLVGNIDLLTNAVFLPFLEQSIPVIHLLGFAQPGYPIDCTPNSPLYWVGANSDYGRQGVIKQGYPLDEIGVVYPGAFVRQFRMCCLPNLDKLRIVFASLVLPYKGPQTLIEALAILHYAGVDFECSIAGDAPNQDFLNHLKTVAKTRGFENKVHFLGYIPHKELVDLFATHNVLVFPSVWEEPFGRSQVEAMAAGLTLITSGTGGSAEIVEPGVGGLTFPPGNAFALAEALMGLTKNPEAWKQMAIAGQKRAELFDIDRSIDFLEEKFEELLRIRDNDVEFLQRKYLPDLQERLRLRETNLMIFPDWSRPEESLALELQAVLKAIASRSDHNEITLLVDCRNISEQDADMALSSVAMNLMMEEDLDVSEGPEISIIGQLSQVQWQTLSSVVKGKIDLENENRDAIVETQSQNLPSIIL